ncbi:hypothetical protein [Blastococcus sp. CCUG 61487]|uniref:hypothetical protein n=1 Tax=Blastococcus sp. CCUG 61487 TaxID=1840703 RepID=UPI0010C13AF1|nr:hypothetical protein [Blastococcus sp. CCUG 61487]TKJ16857.1 hypothetical protein A6V29_12800 [Blastococcus sp. CCUG 61487]
MPFPFRLLPDRRDGAATTAALVVSFLITRLTAALGSRPSRYHRTVDRADSDAPHPRKDTMSTPDSSPRRQAGATPVGASERKRRPGWLIPLLLGIAAVVIALLLLSQCGADDTDAAGAADPSSSATEGNGSSSPSPDGSTPAPTAAQDGGDAGQPGTVTANGTSLLPLAAGSDPAGALSASADQPVVATAVQVLSVPADEGFWIGTSEAERIWAQLTGDGESPYQVQPGDVVDLQGTLVAHSAGFAGQVGVAEADGAAQLDAQGHHIEAAKTAVTLSQ